MVKYLIKSILIVCFFGIVYGFTIPNYEGYITDKVGIFSATQKANLNVKIEEIEKATSIEIAILVVSTVDDDINFAAIDVGNQWGVGKKGKNNGLVVLIAVDDRKWSVQVGYGLEGTLPDIATKNMAEARFPPNFREGNYYQGVIEMLDDALGYIKQDPTLVQRYSQSKQIKISNFFNEDTARLSFFIVFFLISGFGRWVTIPSIAKDKGRKMKKYGRWIYAGSGLVLGLLIAWILANFIIAFLASYFLLLMGILIALFGKQSGGPMFFGGGSGGFGLGGGGFGGFGGGSFGGGGSSGSR